MSDTTIEADESDAQSDAVDVVDDSKGRLRRLGRRGLAVAAGVIVAAAALIGSNVYFYFQDRHSRDLLDAREEARLAACAYAPILANYDAKNLDAYFAAVSSGATGDWKKQFESTTGDLRDVLKQGQVNSHVTDTQCAIRSGDAHSAEAIVVIGQTITSVGTQGKPEPGQLSMVMWLEKSGNRWLINKLNSPLAQPPQQ
ncbi:hypothetical protein [Nocardia terpenica]|uniref:Mce-associated membrane protein n=1 Tax=Nocardia terpenica TaxID=455432 RepID=A0A164J2D0_9NOCA|nr:hypothetical protein [Nocardia terpenica]KZM69975.1 hypothetical protein AWN90_05090 [Nocardia terpenica]NQE91355.1 hypothetical protein [Nocardia terpenica]